MKKSILSIGICLIIILPATGTATVWKITTDSTETYIAGTVHILRQSDYPLPAAFERVYDKADLLVFEIDPAKLAGPEVQQAILSKGMYTDSTTLDQILSEAVYSRLEEFCSGMGVPVASLNRLKPSLAALTLLSLELQKLGITQEGVDIHYANRAAADEKPIESLETVEEQIELLTSLGDGNEDNFIIYTIQDLKQIKEKMPQMITAWKTADIDELNELFTSDVREKFPDIYKTTIVDRNINWLAPIETYIATPETEFILVGTAHLVGDDGVIYHLRKHGYELELLVLEDE